MRRCGLKHGALFVESADQPVGDFGDFFASEHTDKMVNLRTIDQKFFFLPFGQAARDDYPAQIALLFELQHFVDRRERLVPRLLDETAGVDHREVGTLRIVDQLVSVQLQHAEHAFAVHQVLGAAEADEGVTTFGVSAAKF